MIAEVRKSIEVARFLASDPVASVKTGVTPHRVIHRQGKQMVRYFAPEEAKTAPVFISMPLINTWTIFDLLPGRSVVEALVAAGVPVYLFDWGRPSAEDQEVRVSDLLHGVLHRAIDRTRRHAAVHHGSDTLDAIGYCVGGTFLTAYLGLYPEASRRVVLVATPIDFHKSGRLVAWANPETFPLDDIIDGHGNFPKSLMSDSFTWLKPSNSTAKWKGLWDRFESPGFTELWSALEQWNGDSVDFPGETYREYVQSCYFDNKLMDNSWIIGGQRVDLGNVKIPALVLPASRDHIVPPAAAEGLAEVWGGQVTVNVLKGGHVGICVGRSMPKALIEWAQA